LVQIRDLLSLRLALQVGGCFCLQAAILTVSGAQKSLIVIHVYESSLMIIKRNLINVLSLRSSAPAQPAIGIRVFFLQKIQYFP
jgi:hypothetical protein